MPDDSIVSLPRDTFENIARTAGLSLDVAWLPNPGASGDEWRDQSFRFEFVLRRDGKVILTGPYWTGVGHAVYRGKPLGGDVMRRRDVTQAILRAVQTGKPQPHPDRVGWTHKLEPRMPTLADVLGSLIMDDPNDSTYEEWCADLGYDPDSRKAEATFRAVSDNTVRLRRAVDAATWDRLREAAREL